MNKTEFNSFYFVKHIYLHQREFGHTYCWNHIRPWIYLILSIADAQTPYLYRIIPNKPGYNSENQRIEVFTKYLNL